MTKLAGKFSLTPKQERLLAALLQGSTIVDAAKAAGVSERTAHTYLALSHVQQAWRQARVGVYDHAIARLQSLCGHAVTTLEKNLSNDTGAGPGVRAIQVRAAELILDQARHASEISALQDQIDELKQTLGIEVDAGGARRGQSLTLKRIK